MTSEAEVLEQAWQKWLDAIPKRVSRRRFGSTETPVRLLEGLEAVCEGFRPFGSARAMLVREVPDGLFRGIVGAYGSIRGARHCLLMVGHGDAAAEVGYVGEAAVLEATALGLGTCWVGGLFDRATAAQLVVLAPGERIFAISPVGRVPEVKRLEERLMSAVARARTRRPLEVVARGAGSWPGWARSGAEAARLAPSAVNRQPWRFSKEGHSVLVAQDSEKDTYRIPKRLDCGIAMLHFELGARGAGMAGEWRLEPSPKTASFHPGRR
ncbi:MAG: nitroreductase family protein [Deltaproteobacteria bacterium]|nr:nitroreductase family protein [Deltaproteobacteria bacterium]